MKLDGKIESKPGVYMIKNTVNGKIYIGSSVDMKRRARQHYHSFKKGHGNSLLDRAYKKYGEDSFTFSVLEYCEESTIRVLEQSYIIKYDTLNKSIGYNLAGVTELGLPILSEEARKRISKSSRDRVLKTRTPEERSAWAKKIHEQRTKEERIRSAQKASKEMWKDKTTEDRIKIMRPVCEAAWEKTRKKVICSNGTVYESLSECSRQIGLCAAAIHRLIKTKGKSRKLNKLSFAWYQEDSDAFSN